jgi:serine beta-lactamase-like protein LACTB
MEKLVKLSLLLSLALPQILSAQNQKKTARVAEHFADSLRRKQDIPGLSVAVGSAKQIYWAKGFGFADLENRVSVTASSRFRIGSVSKCLTAIAIGRLYQEGKLDLDSPVQHYLPAYPQKKYSITSRELAGHLAGIRHYTDADTLHNPTRHYQSITEALNIFKNDTLLFRPGTAYQYSTYGFSLLGAVIEAAANAPFLRYMEQDIFLPLGMNQTVADYPDSVETGRVRFYEHDGKGHLVNAAMVDNSYKWPGGGYLSTPTDLVKLAQGLMNHTLLNEATVATLFSPQNLENGESTGVGIAWRIGKDSKGRRIIHHGGSIDGGRTFILIYPDDDLAVAITANMSGVDINFKEAEKIANFFTNTKP